jgi:hypothetical protein
MCTFNKERDQPTMKKELYHDIRPVSWSDLHKSLESILVTAATLPYTPILDIRQGGTELELPAVLKFLPILR